MTIPTINNCDNCGACCMGQAALPATWYVGMYADGESASGKPIPESLRIQLVLVVADFMNRGFPPDGSPCIWFDQATRWCKHYDHRPALCRDEVIPGDESCMRWRTEKGIKP